MSRRVRIVAIVVAAWSHSCSGGDLPADSGANSLGGGTAEGDASGPGPAGPGGSAMGEGDGPSEGGATADGGCVAAQWDEDAWDVGCWQ